MSESTAPKLRRPVAGALGTLSFWIALALLIVLAAGIADGADEAEPNDDQASANPMAVSGSYVVAGNTTAGGDSADFFRFDLTSAAVVEVILTSNWACSGAACENLSVVLPNSSVLIDPFGDPMSGRDVYFSGLAGSTWYVRVAAGSPGGSYRFTVIVYPFPYSSGERVGIVEANTSSAIVAFADASAKSSTHPYDLWTEGDGVYYGYPLALFVVNVGPLDLSLQIPSGLLWFSEDDRFTDFVVTQDQFVTVDAWTWTSVDFQAVAESPHAWVPGDPSRPNNDPTYFLGPLASGDLRKITDEAERRSYSDQAEQIAVWAYTAGQTANDFQDLGASNGARSEAISLLNRAGVYTAINPRTTSWFSWLTGWTSWWPFCFMLFFLGIPFLFGISQAMRAVRIKHLDIDAAYAVSRGRIRQARDERRAYVHDMRQRERDRRRARREQERAASRPVQTEPAAVPVPSPAPVPRPATPLSESARTLGRFHAMDAEERFDLDGLNMLDFNSVLSDAMATKQMAADTSKKAGDLLRRIHQDVADPDTVDDILRDRIVRWYRDSAGHPDWATSATRAWSGLVAESRAAGGRKRTPLERRLTDLKEACEARGKWIKPKPKVEAQGARRGRPSVAPPPDPAAVKAQVVQAVLDDLAAVRKAADSSQPLPVLSELAAKLTPQRVNTALAEMFKADPRGPYVLLHPSRYPDCDITVIRPPAQGAKAGAMAYDLYFAKAQAPLQQAQGGGLPGGGPVMGGPVPGLLDTSGALWRRESVSKEEWSAVLGELQRQRQRLEPPPSNYRRMPPYFTLRELLITDEAARRAFIGVKWRGKPVGLSLLTQLLLDKTLVLEFDTDREYFEAELGDLERGDPAYQSPAGRWTIGSGVTVSRVGDAAQGFTYKL